MQVGFGMLPAATIVRCKTSKPAVRPSTLKPMLQAGRILPVVLVYPSAIMPALHSLGKLLSASGVITCGASNKRSGPKKRPSISSVF